MLQHKRLRDIAIPNIANTVSVKSNNSPNFPVTTRKREATIPS